MTYIHKYNFSDSKKLILASLMLLIAFISVFVAVPNKAKALSGADFNAGRIIDDSVFYNQHSMSAGEIQNFLNSKVPTCDTNGTQWHWSGRTRAQHGTANGAPPPYICLKNYTQAIPTVTNSGSDLCSGSVAGGTKSAAQIIYDVAQACGVNPQVLLVLLQKEQSLITDDWPWPIQYRSATGYGCPDTAPCDAEFYGFFNQVYQAAKAYKRYRANPTNYNYRAGRNNTILWHPNAACGSSTVWIENQATAGLYTYTPYRPNQAALNNLYGTGDGCSSYGNRNFWRMFNDWFNQIGTIYSGVVMTNISQPVKNPARGQTISYVFDLTNNLTTEVTLDAVGVVGRLDSINGANRDFGWQGPVTLSAGETRRFTFTTMVREIGTLYAWPAINFRGSYAQYNNWGTTLVSHAPNLLLSQPLTTNPTTVYAGQNVTFSAVLKNNEPYEIYYDAIGIPVKFYDHYNYDATWVGPGVIAAGAEITLSGTRNIDKPGPFTYWVSNYFGGTYSTIGSVNKFSSAEATPSFSVSGLSFNNTSPALGQNIEATFTVTNDLPVPIDVDGVGVIGRLGTFAGQNRDISWQGPIHFNAGETKTFTGYIRAISDVGAHHYWIGVYDNGGYLQYNNWGSTIVSLAPSFSVSGLSFNTTSPVVGQSLEASFTVTNNLSTPIDVDGVGVVGRYGTFSGPNRDIGWQGPIHFDANETKTFTGYSRSITEVGTHYYWIGIFDNGGYLQYNNWGSTIVSQ